MAGSIMTKRQADISPCLFILTQSLQPGDLIHHYELRALAQPCCRYILG